MLKTIGKFAIALVCFGVAVKIKAHTSGVVYENRCKRKDLNEQWKRDKQNGK